MKNKSLKDRILTVLTAVLCLVIIAAGVQMGVVIVKANSSGSSGGSTDADDYDVVFTGNITMYDESYEVSLKGKEGSFSVDASNLKDVVDGTYTYTPNQGWTFIFKDDLGTNVRSQYDKDKKRHYFVYALNLGSRGTGNILFTRDDSNFEPAAEPWDDIPSFSGNASWFDGVLNATIYCSCDADGNFRIFGTGNEINEITGTYRVTGESYTFTTDDGMEYTSSIDEDSNLPAFTIAVHRPSLEAYGAADTDVELLLVQLTPDESVTSN